MSYPPKHHQESNFETIITTIRAYPLATLLTIDNSKLHISHLPLLYETTDNGFGKLVGHLDKYNPQAGLLQAGKDCTVIFNGPDTYISPSVYKSKQLPTWNYIKVHLNGKAKILSQVDEVKTSIVKMTTFLEGKEQLFKLDHDDERMARLVDYIIGFQIDITSWEGKYKLSQDKSEEDNYLAKLALQSSVPNHKRNYIDLLYNATKTPK